MEINMCPWLVSRTLQHQFFQPHVRTVMLMTVDRWRPPGPASHLGPGLWDSRRVETLIASPGNTINVQLIIWQLGRGSACVPAGLFLQRSSRPFHSFIILCFVWMWLFRQQRAQLPRTCRPMQRSSCEDLCNDSLPCRRHHRHRCVSLNIFPFAPPPTSEGRLCLCAHQKQSRATGNALIWQNYIIDQQV